MNKKELIEEIKKIERKVDEMRKSVPVHSPKVSMMQELEDLEEELERKKRKFLVIWKIRDFLSFSKSFSENREVKYYG